MVFNEVISLFDKRCNRIDEAEVCKKSDLVLLIILRNEICALMGCMMIFVIVKMESSLIGCF